MGEKRKCQHVKNQWDTSLPGGATRPAEINLRSWTEGAIKSENQSPEFLFRVSAGLKAGSGEDVKEPIVDVLRSGD